MEKRLVAGRVCMVVNPISGPGRAVELLRGLCERLRREGYELVISQTHGPGHARELAAGVADDARAVLVGGGDGTVREVSEGLLGRGIPLYHLPLGNENLFAKAFGMTLDGSKVAASLGRGRRRAIDVVRVNGERLCIACLGVGFDGHVVKLLARKRKGPVSNLDYVGPIWETFWRYPFPDLTVHVDGKEVFNAPGIVMAGNLPRYGGGLPVFASARPDDGLLDVLVVPCDGKVTFLRSALLVLLGRETQAGAIRIRARSLRVGGGPAAVQIDGDVGPELPVEASVLPGRLMILEA
jgi:diacylglycerol kinase family enzyme